MPCDLRLIKCVDLLRFFGAEMFISGLLPRVAHAVPSAIALKHGARRLTYEELAFQASCLARAFADYGVTPGDRVALLGHPGIDLVIAEHAAIAIGAIPLGIYSTLALPEIQAIVHDAAPSVLVFDPAFGQATERMTYASRPLEVACDRNQRCPSVSELVERSQPLTTWHQAAPSDPALIVYTGGTSGRPKGVLHTHGAVSSWVNMEHPRGPAYAPQQRSTVFNLAHLSGQANLWKTLAAGGRLVFLPRYPPSGSDILSSVHVEGITNIGTVGGTFSDLVHATVTSRYDLRPLCLVAVGGSSTSAHILQRAIEAFPNAMILVVYSLSESGQLVSALSVNDAVKSGRLDRLRSVGIPGRSLFGQQPFSMRIVGAAGRQVPTGSSGEILLAGPQVMSGYWNNEAATNRALRDGWLYTGDIGRLDHDGYLYLLDRSREVVIGHNGVNVYPSEVENVVAQHPAVREVCVFGRPCADAAEEIMAAIVVRDGAGLTLAELRDFCTGRIAAFKFPASITVFESLPRTGAGKIDKPRVRELCS